jgi:hypothetical protein
VRERMADRARRQGRTTSADRYQRRALELARQAQQVRSLVLTGLGAAEEVEEPASEER